MLVRGCGLGVGGRGRAVLLVGAALVACGGCGGPKAYVRAGFLDHPPRRLAVLPFVITYAYDLAKDQTLPESHAVGREIFRKTLYQGLTPLGYEDLKLADVDARLTQRWGPLEEGAWQAASPQALGEVLGVDAILYGEISRLMHFSTPLYTETSLDASLRMVEVSSGEVLWRKRVKAADRGGALLKKGQVVDFLEDQARSFHPSVKFLRVADMAVQQTLKGFPNPPLAATEQGVAGERAGGSARATLRLAVLPLETTHKNWRRGAEALRADLVANLQDGPFDVLEIQRVDAALKSKGWVEGEPLPSGAALSEAARPLAADALLRGSVTTWGRTYWVVQSWVKAGMQLDLIDAASGDVIWSKKQISRRQAGILKGPTGYQSVVTAPLMGLRTRNLEQVAHRLARDMAEALGVSPAVKVYVSEHPAAREAR